MSSPVGVARPMARGGCRAPWGLASLILALAACGTDFQPPAATGQPAPEYRAETLDGEPFVLAGLVGEVVLLNIWATWCPPCRMEMPELQSLHRELSDFGLRVVGVSVDAAGSDRAVRTFLDDLGIDFQIVRDPAERVSTTFGAYGVPLTVLVDREGIIRWRHLGPITADNPGLRAVLDQTLGSDRPMGEG
jgi:cytochrome c biogenesis protein CcmG, thiol:disulfide interchange protein DsbE